MPYSYFSVLFYIFCNPVPHFTVKILYIPVILCSMFAYRFFTPLFTLASKLGVCEAVEILAEILEDPGTNFPM